MNVRCGPTRTASFPGESPDSWRRSRTLPKCRRQPR
jgi:hypothetical protein